MLGSELSAMGMGMYAAYCASKFGVVGLTKALAAELAPDVRVNGVAPGVVASEVVHWQQHGLDGRNVNWTTPDYLSDLGANSSYHTNLVQVRPLKLQHV